MHVKELKFVSVDKDANALILKDASDTKYLLLYSKSVENAIKQLQVDSKPTAKNSVQTEVSTSTFDLTPREIQMHVRAGVSAQELQNRYGIPLDKVHRYSDQVEREKQMIIEFFQHLPARSEKKGMDLVELVYEYFDANDIDRRSANWVSLREENKPWQIRLYFKQGTSAYIAYWSWDKKEMIISEDNEIAREITKYYLDATNGEESVQYGTPTKPKVPDVKTIHSPKTLRAKSDNAKLTTLSGGLRLRELDKLRNELDEDFSAISDIKDTFETSGLKLVTNDSAPIAKTEKLPNNDKKIEPALVKTADKSNESKPDIDDLNITGKLRAKFSKSNSKRKNVPSWDDVMFPTSDNN